MKATRVLVTALGSIALGALLLPGAALADTTVSPSTTTVGETVLLTATNCSPSAGDAIFHLSGPDRDQNVRSTTAPASGGLSAELFTAGFTLGTYTVAATCGDRTPGGSTTFTVAPIGGAQAGGGAGSDGTGTLVAGATLLVTALGGAVILARRRRHAANAATL
ncbi:hypothetical protein C1I95_05455 [Micromonospora craterilacus]|uniref:Cell wall protein n=1 Tax=Micromonospora craterilacus TaxID=1655439 RepID=A0A2W2EIG4_9ACTN|nr:hypothetical protein [Micromonospora craterilacus]PZG22441.1 hypothetical protein C1I95_05455 [Micromonospora craterilacus]